MSRDIERTVADLNKWLLYVASDAERYKDTSELIARSPEFRMAAIAIETTLPHPSLASVARGPFLRVRVGTNAVNAFDFRKLPYGFLESEETVAQPGEVHDLKFMKCVGTDVLNPRKIQPVFGQLKYFD